MLHLDERNPTPAPVAALYDYFEAATRSRSGHPSVPVSSDSAAATRGLSPVERATARITLGPPVTGVGAMHEAIARLRVLDARGLLDRLSFSAIATTLQMAMFSVHPRSLRYSAKAVLTLELCDRYNLIEVWLSTPDQQDSRRYRRVRLSERMHEIRAKADSEKRTSERHHHDSR